MNELSVQGLVARAQRGDREAFGALYEQFAPGIYRFLYYRAKSDAALAEDLTADVFVKVIAKLHTYQNRGIPFQAWLYRLAGNLLLDHVRRPSPVDPLPVEEHHELAAPDAERAFEGVLTRGELAEALGDLTDQQRQVVMLRFLQGMNVAQAAAAMGKTEDGIKKLQMRGLINLRRALTAGERERSAA